MQRYENDNRQFILRPKYLIIFDITYHTTEVRFMYCIVVKLYISIIEFIERPRELDLTKCVIISVAND